MLIPLGIGLLLGGAYAAKVKRETKATVTPEVAAERAVIYDTAINTIKDPDKLRKLAGSFHEAGLHAEATMLLKRAELAEAPTEVKAARKEAYQKGMASKDPTAVRHLAAAFEEVGATGAAASLRDYAAGLVETVAMDAGQPAESAEVTETESEVSNEQPTE